MRGLYERIPDTELPVLAPLGFDPCLPGAGGFSRNRSGFLPDPSKDLNHGFQPFRCSAKR